MSIVTGFSAVRKAIHMTFFEEQNLLLIFLVLPLWYGWYVFISGSPPAFRVGGLTLAGQVSSVVSQGIVAGIEILVFYWIVRGGAALLGRKRITDTSLQSTDSKNHFRWSFVVAFFLAFIVMWSNHLGELEQQQIDERIDFCLQNNVPFGECITDENLPSLRNNER